MTTYLNIEHGTLIKCDNTTILCNSEEILCDGSVVLRPVNFYETLYSNTYENEGHLVQEDGYDILLENGFFLLWEEAARASTQYFDIAYYSEEIPTNALRDANGLPVLDANGTYILVAD